MQRLAILITTLLIATISWAIYMANAGQQHALIDFVRDLPHGDKVGHFLLFGLLALFLNLALRFRCISVARISLPVASLLVCGVAVSEEISQIYLPTRSFDLMDIAADFAGITFFTLLGWIPVAIHRRVRTPK